MLLGLYRFYKIVLVYIVRILTGNFTISEENSFCIFFAMHSTALGIMARRIYANVLRML